jgi:Tol biopolymer transport system component
MAAAIVVLTFMGSFFAVASESQSGKIAFASDRSGSWQIYTMNPDGSDQVQVTNLAPTDDDGLFCSISPDGKHIAFAYNAGDGPDLYLMNFDGTDVRQLTTDHSSFLPRWSPDGTRLVFSTFAGLRAAVIATMPADGSGERQLLTSDLWDSIGGIYTADGKHIVFGSEMGGFVSAVWIMNADGSHQRRLTRAALRAQPWSTSPDGQHILAYTNQDSPPALGSSIVVMNLDGSGRKRLAPLSQFHHDLYPTYSPDGKQISLMSDRFSTDIDPFTYGTFDIFTMNADGSDLTDVAPAVGSCPFDGNCVTPFWGPSPSGFGSTETSAPGATTDTTMGSGSAQTLSSPARDSELSGDLAGEVMIPNALVRGHCSVDSSTKKLTGRCSGSVSLHCVGKSDPANCPVGQPARSPKWVQMCVYGRLYVDAARTCSAQ